MDMVKVDHLTKYYGDYPAIEDVSFSVRKGEIVGFLGPNGAGKTTSMRIITGFMPPTRGTVHIDGFDVVDQSLEARKRIGYLPETVPLYTDMTVSDYLSFMGTIRGMPRDRLGKRVDAVIDICRLGDYTDSLIGKLSKGFRQRVGIAQAILHEPQVLIMDEPTIGIDPIQVVETRALIKDLGREHTVILSTHILPEVSVICQRVLIIDEGRIVAEDRPENLERMLGAAERVEIEVRGPIPEVLTRLRQVSGVMKVNRVTESGEEAPPDGADVHRYVLECSRERAVKETVASAIVQGGWGLQSLKSVGMSLEEIFLRLTTKETEGS